MMKGFAIYSLCLLVALCWTVSAAESVFLTLLYDNYLYNESLHTAWGFSCLVEVGKRTILFDTGGDAETLLSNMAALKVNPQQIEIVVLSHVHGDHTGGLFSLLELNNALTVYLPTSFPKDFKERVKTYGASVVEVQGPTEIIPGVWSTGKMGTGITEQALVVQSPKGLLVVTGCAHPGVVNMVKRAKEIASDKIRLVVGGFHMAGMSQKQIQEVIRALQELGVEEVAPCHCSGDFTRQLFHEAYGNAFCPAGVGWPIEFSPSL
jgi:7,8-dihydropterin-6-yl-methyl-4-(beta-D-ribofuranosyl)aminobenzene 5'-phosphate synthase